MADPDKPETPAGGAETPEEVPQPAPAPPPRSIASRISAIESKIGFAEDATVRPLTLLEVGGIFVFVISALFGLLVLVLGASIGDLYAGEPWVWLRTGENLFRIAAVGILVSFISRSLNAYVNIIGVLVIGALIIPTKDMVQFALLFTQQEAKMNDLFPDASSQAEFQGNDRLQARAIIGSLARLQAFDADAVKLDDAEDWTDEVISVIERHRAGTQAERVRLRGAEQLLIALYLGQFEAYSFRNGRYDQFGPNLEFLRRDGLVLFEATDYQSAVPTRRGCIVAAHIGMDVGLLANPEDGSPVPVKVDAAPAGEGSEGAGVAGLHATCRVACSGERNPCMGETRESDLLEWQRFMSLPEDRVQQVLTSCRTNAPPFDDFPSASLLRPGAGTEVAYNASPVVYKLEGAVGSLELRLVADTADEMGPDPYLYLLARQGSNCGIVDRNDDYIGLDSRIAFDAEPDREYFAVAEAFSGQLGIMRLTFSEVAAATAPASAP